MKAKEFFDKCEWEGGMLEALYNYFDEETLAAISNKKVRVLALEVFNLLQDKVKPKLDELSDIGENT